MQRFVVIGLGRFGSRLAANLAAAGEEVIGVDKDQAVVEDIRDRVTLAVALDATDEQALRMQGIDQVDVAVVGIGNDFEAVVLATVLLKQLGVPRVISRAMTATGATILLKIGADEVANPEDESADRWSSRLVAPQFLKQFELEDGHSIVEVKTPASWAGQSLVDLHLRAKRGLHVVAVKRPRNPEDPASARAVYQPSPTDPLQRDDVLVVMGRNADLAKLPKS
jgi:trk system potassium uptake protein TrkA